MTETDRLLDNNAEYAKTFRDGDLPMPPARGVVVVACMDARMMLADMLGLKSGEAHVIRNAGGIVNEETLRSLLISTRRQGTREVIVINHTDCGMMTFTDEGFREQLQEELGRPIDPIRFHAFQHLEENVRRQVARVRSDPLLPSGLTVRGFVYDVRNGRLQEVAVPAG